MDTLLKALKRMKPPSEPKINKSDPNMWFIYWNHDVPFSLWHKHQRMRERIKVYDNLNDFKGEKNAEFRRQVWKYSLEVEKYNPFAAEMEEYHTIVSGVKIEEEKIEEAEKIVIVPGKGDTPLFFALDLFTKSRVRKTKNTSTLSAYKTTVSWIKKYFEVNSVTDIRCHQLTRDHIAEASLLRFDEGTWGGKKYNNEINQAMVILNWMGVEGYIVKNLANGTIEKMEEHTSIHEWYDRDLAVIVKQELRENCMIVYRACQFTYHLCIRSQKELMMLKARDIDRYLKRIRFRKELSKNKTETYRDYSEEFEKVLDDLDFNKIPGEFLLFGRGGVPGLDKAGKNTLADLFRPIKEKLGLGFEYTIYGWKHTRVVHEMMKGADPYEIQHLCRHGDLDATQKYMRNFTISLKRIYKPEDLTF